MHFHTMKKWSLFGIVALAAAGCSDSDLTEPSRIDESVLKPQASSTGTWETKAPRLTASAQGFAAQIGTVIYSIGGAHAHLSEPATAQAYDLATDSWTHRTAPAATHAWTAAEYAGRIYIFGGWDGRSVHNTTQIYDPATDRWSAGTGIPRAHNLGAAGVIGSKIYVAAGSNSSGYLSTTDVYEPATGQWTVAAAIPQPRAFTAGAVVDGILYVVGGDNGLTRLATLHAYDPSTDSWATKAPMPTARAGAVAVNFAGKLYVLGGSTNAAYSNPDYSASLTSVVEVYDPATDTWSVGEPLLSPRQAPQAAVANGIIHAVAGFASSGSVALHEALSLITPPPSPPANPTTIEQCFKGGWQTFGFRNQGQCVRFVQTSKDSR